jgi:hypothetical protein
MRSAAKIDAIDSDPFVCLREHVDIFFVVQRDSPRGHREAIAGEHFQANSEQSRALFGGVRVNEHEHLLKENSQSFRAVRWS